MPKSDWPDDSGEPALTPASGPGTGGQPDLGGNGPEATWAGDDAGPGGGPGGDRMPPPVPPPERSRRANRLAWVVGFLGAVVVGALISAAFVTLPYYTMSPGSVLDASEDIRIDGTPTDEPAATVSYTTVSIKPVTALELLVGWLDGDVDIRHRREILGDRDPEENRELNMALMGSSQHFATYVALQETGYEVDVEQTGDMVAGVLDGFPAEGEIDRGDVILEAEGQALESPGALVDLLEDDQPGDRVELVVAPFDDLEDRRTVSLTLAPGPDDPGRGIIGVQLTPFELDFDFPVDVAFETGDVGGPSAGLAFTLTLIDLLTEGDLTGGLDVAVTGEMGIDGDVGSVGGTGQKAAAARSAGMDAFLVPDSGRDHENAVPHAGDMEVVEVGTIDDALRALEELGGDPVGDPVGAG